MHLSIKDVDLLYKIQSFFGVGHVSLHGDSCMFSVISIQDIKLIIQHFMDYPLITQKHADFLLFQQAFDIINNKDHLTIQGFKKLISLRASMNKGLPERLKLAFQEIIPVIRPEVPKFSFLNNCSNIKYWIAGFVSGEGCFYIQTSKSKTHKLGISVTLNFYVSQNIRDSYLLESLQQFFDCGSCTIIEKSGIIKLSIRNFKDLTEKIIPFFEEYKLQGLKAKEFNEFKEACLLIKSKSHLTKEGLEKINKIKSGMNFNRE